MLEGYGLAGVLFGSFTEKGFVNSINWLMQSTMWAY
jgi:hypothetical protein